ncbi:MAG: hypothetical protein HOA31_00735 [Euryarchaeota archaeon]|jgi:hypothetical protein|nr:hypothetical protein [Euryarchaeota archaeon]
MTDKSLVLKGFNEHFMEFIDDIYQVFPHDSEILATKNALGMLRKANPRMIIDVWHRHITIKYENEINNSNIDFFVNKDYSNDVKSMNNTDKIISKINMLKQPISEMSETDQAKTLKYIQNLSKLTTLYFID